MIILQIKKLTEANGVAGVEWRRPQKSQTKCFIPAFFLIASRWQLLWLQSEFRYLGKLSLATLIYNLSEDVPDGLMGSSINLKFHLLLNNINLLHRVPVSVQRDSKAGCVLGWSYFLTDTLLWSYGAMSVSVRPTHFASFICSQQVFRIVFCHKDSKALSTCTGNSDAASCPGVSRSVNLWNIIKIN